MKTENHDMTTDRQIKLTQLDRQLLLYEIFLHCREVVYAEISCRIPISARTLQRDIADLTAAGLIFIRFSKKRKAYVHRTGSDGKYLPCQIDESVTGKRALHLKRLARIGTLMTKLGHDEVDLYEPFDRSKYKSCKDNYFEQFPDASLRMMQHDFAELNRIGYPIRYIRKIDFYVMWESPGLRESFGMEERNGVLYRDPSQRHELESLAYEWEELLE